MSNPVIFRLFHIHGINSVTGLHLPRSGFNKENDLPLFIFFTLHSVSFFHVFLCFPSKEQASTHTLAWLMFSILEGNLLLS